jgi:hypothetical protein
MVSTKEDKKLGKEGIDTSKLFFYADNDRYFRFGTAYISLDTSRIGDVYRSQGFGGGRRRLSLVDPGRGRRPSLAYCGGG